MLETHFLTKQTPTEALKTLKSEHTTHLNEQTRMQREREREREYLKRSKKGIHSTARILELFPLIYNLLLSESTTCFLFQSARLHSRISGSAARRLKASGIIST